MQSLQMKPKLNCLFKLVCSKYVENTCSKEFKVKNVCVLKGYFTLYFMMIISTLESKLNQEIFHIG